MNLFVDAARAKEFECIICYEIYKEPVQIGCQEHVFCKQCIDELISKQGRSFHCPLCRRKCTSKTVTRVKFIDRQINDLKVICPNAAVAISTQTSIAIGNQNDYEQNTNSLRRSSRIKANKHCGKKRQRPFTLQNTESENVNPNKRRKLNESSKTCEWQGRYSDLSNHTKTCPLQVTNCKYCDMSILQSDLKKHFENCPKFLMKCIQCKQTKICRNKMEKHISEYCSMTLINCKHCKHKMRRKDMKLHIKTECPESIIKCTFYEFGCKEKLKRKDEKNHVENAAFTHTHLVQIANNQKKLKQENVRLNNRIGKVENELGSLKNELGLLKNQVYYGASKRTEKKTISDFYSHHIFHVGDKVMAMDYRHRNYKNKFMNATIKAVHGAGVTVSWDDPKWKDGKWDMYISKYDFHGYLKKY